ncbi:polysaccharide biosynthesis/export family protein [Nibrella saemangeumensis]|uniref:Polysaccharide biosynthesis/export family protein n=1 Tax=Nibrella saemangeumensis TaxID=1084526 RepID=A0ABP8MZB5_9BACT
MRNLTWLVLSLLCLNLVSCISQKEIAYFQDESPESQEQVLTITNRYVPTIQPSDILSIYVSSLNPEATNFFNPYAPAERVASAPTQPGQISTSVGYLVDNEGMVELPLLGKIKLAGMTTVEAREVVREKLKVYLKEPTVNIRFLNYKVSVLGEVARPSLFNVPNEKITLPEALSLAGDITIYGRRDNVLIIRETNGKREFARVNMNRRDLFQSPYYYLHPNDVVYVEPGRGRVATADRLYQLVPAALSALSFIAIVVQYTR